MSWTLFAQVIGLAIVLAIIVMVSGSILIEKWHEERRKEGGD